MAIPRPGSAHKAAAQPSSRLNARRSRPARAAGAGRHPALPGHHYLVTLYPAGQYSDDRNLSARQRLWHNQTPFFDIADWVLGLAGVSAGMRVLDVGCGNGVYLRTLRERGVRAAGCDRSMGMLRTAAHPALVNADAAALPVRDRSADVVLAAHMLDLVPDRPSAFRELRRVLAPGGVCVAVTNGSQHLRSLRELLEHAVRRDDPGWRMIPPTRTFAAENALEQLGMVFGSVSCVRPASAGPVVIRDAAVAAGYVASLASHYQDEVSRPWDDVAGDVGQDVQAVIDSQGSFTTRGDLAAFVCR